MINVIFDFVNQPFIVMVVGSILVFTITNKILELQEERKVKHRVFQVLIETRNLNQDMEKYKTMRLIPSLFNKSPKVIKSHRTYISSLNPGRQLSDNEIISLTIETNNNYDDLITEIGREIKVFKYNEFYQDNKEYLPQWISDKEVNTSNNNKIAQNVVDNLNGK